MCPNATRGCKASCLFTAGRGTFTNVKLARIRKKRELVADKADFITRLCKDIERLERRAKNTDMRMTFRLNGTSDIPWETRAYGGIPQRYPHLVFYDYSKSLRRVLNKNRPSNYHLTFSRTERNEKQCLRALDNGVSVTAVFDEVPVGETMWGYKIIDGDEDDLRFLTEGPVVVGVKAKGRARKDRTGFVIRTKGDTKWQTT